MRVKLYSCDEHFGKSLYIGVEIDGEPWNVIQPIPGHDLYGNPEEVINRLEEHVQTALDNLQNAKPHSITKEEVMKCLAST